MAVTAGAPDWTRLRALFPAVRDGVYLNTASYGPGPDPVREAVEEGLREWSTGEGDWPAWEARAVKSRGLMARFAGTTPECVTLTSSLSAAAAQVAESLPAPPSPEAANIVCGREEFRSNLYPWMNQAARGFEIRLVDFHDGRLDPKDLVAAVDARTSLVAVSHVQSANGYRIALAPLVEACRANGARLFVDATQSLGALAIPLDGIDYLAAAAYKWLLSPRGAAFLLVAPERLGEMRPLQPSWKTPADPYRDYYGPPYDPPRDASALDASLAWPVWLGTTRALELLCEIGAEAIEERDLELARRFRTGLGAAGLAPLFDEEESSQIVALSVPDAEATRAALRAAGVRAAVRSGYLRASFHFYNDESDVDRALAALSGSRARPRRRSPGP